MDSETMAAIAAAACFLVATLACSRSEEAGIWLGIAGAAFLAASLVARGWGARYWPLRNSYEFALAFALATALCAVFIGRRKEQLASLKQIPTVRAAAMMLAAALIVYARMGMPAVSREVRPRSPGASSIWRPLHFGTAAAGYGALAVAGLAGVICLLQDSGPDSAQPSGKEGSANTPAGQDASWMLDRAMIVGYPLLTLSLLFGALWSWTFGGRLWSWDPHEVALLLTWVLYTAYWPLRKGSRRHVLPTAWLALIGLGCLMFTFIGVGWLVRGTGLQSQYLF